MSTIGTAVQQTVGIPGQLVGQAMSNHRQLLSSQTYQDQIHQHKLYQHKMHQYQMHQQQMHQNQITYHQRSAYAASSAMTSSNHNYNHTAYYSSGNDITDEHEANEKEYQNL